MVESKSPRTSVPVAAMVPVPLIGRLTTLRACTVAPAFTLSTPPGVAEAVVEHERSRADAQRAGEIVRATEA